MKPKAPESNGSSWTFRDERLWTTAEIGTRIAQRSLQNQPGITTSFQTTILGGGEAVYAHAPMRLLEYSGLGDGSYGPPIYRPTLPGQPAMSGVATGIAMYNIERARAEALAEPRWHQIDIGGVFVGRRGFYLQTPYSLHSWAWGSVSSADLVGPGQVQLRGTSTKGPILWILQSDVAEMLFLLWASTNAPRHRQLESVAWLPGQWFTTAFVYVRTPEGQHRAPAYDVIRQVLLPKKR